MPLVQRFLVHQLENEERASAVQECAAALPLSDVPSCEICSLLGFFWPFRFLFDLITHNIEASELLGKWPEESLKRSGKKTAGRNPSSHPYTLMGLLQIQLKRCNCTFSAEIVPRR